MGAVASRRRALRSEAMSSVAAKVRAARAFGEYLSQSHPENRNGADHLLADAYSGHDGSPEMQPAPQNKRRLSLISNGRYEGSLPEEAVSGKPAGEGPQPRVYTISGEPALLPGPEAEAIELAVVKGRHPRHHSQPLRASPAGSREDVSRPCHSWAGSRQGSKECPGCAQLAPSPSPQAFGLDQPPLPEAASRRKKLERMYSVDRVSDDIPIRTWFPKENLFSFQTATTTMQAADSWWFPRVFRGYAERKRRKRENDSASVIQRNFRKHLRMVGSRRVKAQTFAERRERSFSRSWSDPTPMKADTSHDSRDSSDLQSSHCTLGEAFEDLDWETERGLEAVACDTEGFVPPKVMGRPLHHSHPLRPRARHLRGHSGGDREEAERLPQGGQNLEDADFLPGRPRTLVLAQEQGGHLCQSGEGRGHDPLLETVEPLDEQSEPGAERHPRHGLLRPGEPQRGEAVPEPQDPHDPLQGHLRVPPGAVSPREADDRDLL
ncbi:NMDA receptor synaptonuclear signaling and neuronal migration factor isoform X5 [Eubalaena glacialis]|uniref:NMDA receptor synaptonuclear signaling and neuronal migration factor isoform X5 n=1 Tax=Eubalaena glacialis TaxID=27606 RepID=UPI002A5A8594|nr:NMDA receptor synaptonuclear signaling and neuronal migration factor isoform X5 [Eubalaena glacialis]